MTYDFFLLVAIVMICFIPVPIMSQTFRSSIAGKVVLQAYLILILFVFFGWFWTHNGQTLGMRAWRLKAVRHDGEPLNWAQAGKRFLMAILSFASFGMGFLVCLFHPENMTFHDLYSGTKLVMVEKKKKRSGNSSQQ